MHSNLGTTYIFLGACCTKEINIKSFTFTKGVLQGYTSRIPPPHASFFISYIPDLVQREGCSLQRLWFDVQLWAKSYCGCIDQTESEECSKRKVHLKKNVGCSRFTQGQSHLWRKHMERKKMRNFIGCAHRSLGRRTCGCRWHLLLRLKSLKMTLSARLERTRMLFSSCSYLHWNKLSIDHKCWMVDTFRK